jgi:transcriptional regulator
MYSPVQFRECRPEVLASAIRDIRFGTLVMHSGAALIASHIPMVLIQGSEGLQLQGHVSRANPQWNRFDPATDALAIFLGPHAYITPSWYASKAEHQRVVPTWNYISVQATGPLTIVHDTQWLLHHINELTDLNEAGYTKPWSVSDAPPEFIEQLSGAIVGVSMRVRTLEGSWKMAQHRSEADRQGVVEGLLKSGDAASIAVAAEMQRLEAKRNIS